MLWARHEAATINTRIERIETYDLAFRTGQGNELSQLRVDKRTADSRLTAAAQVLNVSADISTFDLLNPRKAG